MAQSLYIKYCEIFNPEVVRDIYVQEDDYEAQAALLVKESYAETVFCNSHVVIMFEYR